MESDCGNPRDCFGCEGYEMCHGGLLEKTCDRCNKRRKVTIAVTDYSRNNVKEICLDCASAIMGRIAGAGSKRVGLLVLEEEDFHRQFKP